MSPESKFKRVETKSLELNLPGNYPWKVLAAYAADLEEYLDVSERVRLDGIIRNHDIDAYLSLAEAWSLQSMCSTDVSLPELRAKYLLASLLKKYQFPTDSKLRIATATETFHLSERLCNLFNTTGHSELLEGDSYGMEILTHAKRFLVRLLGDRLPGHQALLSSSRHGPGATTDTSKGKVSSYDKYSTWPYSCTEGAHRYARFAIETDTRWFGALQDSYRKRFGIPKQMPLDMGVFWTAVLKVVDGNRICFVPKSARTERTIAIEPTLNLYLQLGVDGFIRKRLKRYGVDLDHQEKNQELARLGSMPNCSSRFCTIDLSMASDTISTKLCELFLPSQWFSYLMDLRSPSGELGKDRVDYGKISSMGNGYTFALESAIFTAITYAVFKTERMAFDRNEFAVYGDDIIIPGKLYFKMVEALRLSGFRINLDKTFNTGLIRESCGTDWFQGKPVRPVFMTEMPTSISDLFCDYNRSKRFLSLRFCIESESKVLSLISRWFPEKSKIFLGPYSDEDFDSYIHTDVPLFEKYDNWMYHYPRLVVKPIPRKGDHFLFRKLMHDLRGTSIVPCRFARKVPGSGSRFTVTGRNSLMVGKTYSVSDFWRSTYTDYSPPPLARRA